MNPPKFTGSNVTEDRENSMEELQKVLKVMRVADVEGVELASTNSRVCLILMRPTILDILFI